MRPSEVDKVAFTWQMQLLAEHFNVLPLAEALEHIKNDTLPPRAVCITFDDGYADNYTNALPILQQFNLKATFFVASGFLDGGRMWNDTVIESIRNMDTSTLDLNDLDLGIFNLSTQQGKYDAAECIIQKIKHLPFAERSRQVDHIAARSLALPNDLMMTSDQLKKLHQSGMEIGAHTENHPILAKLNDECVLQEITLNKGKLEGLLNNPIKYFAYPNGKPGIDYLEQQVEIVKKTGFEAAISTQWGVVDNKTDFWQLPRFTPWDKDPVKFIVRIINIYFSTRLNNKTIINTHA